MPLLSNGAREAYVQRLREFIIRYSDDPEQAHIRADDVLCEILTEMGYEDIVEAFNIVPKWYG